MRMRRKSGVAVLAILLPAALSAQETPTRTVTLEEVVVTAQKRSESTQDVPFSVAAVTGQGIERSGAGNIVELARNISGLTITDLGPGQSQVAIRGISAGQVVRDQAGVKESVGIYLDESPISVALFTPDLDLYDLERLEVLRGPQGTLFGAGSSSGTVRYITAQPKLEKYEGSVQFSGQTGTDSEFGGAVKGAVNLPFGDRAALRVAGYYNDMAGFIDSVYPGRGKREDVNSGTKAGARVALLFKPTENLSITPRFVYQKLETDGFPRIDAYNLLGNPFTTTEPPVNPGERGQVTQLQEGIDDDFKLADLKIEYDFGGATFTAVSSYTDREVVVTRDASQLTGSVTYDLTFGHPTGYFPAEVRLNSPLYDATKLEAFSQELRIASNGDGAFSWLAGGFYQQVDRVYGQDLPTPGYDAILQRRFGATSATFNAPPNTPYFSHLTYDFKQFALFGEGTWRFNDQWSLTGGLRYYDFDEDRLLTFAGVFADVGYTREPGSTSSDGFSPRAILAFRPTEDVMLTAQVSRGFRLGGINDPLNVTLCQGNDINTYGGHPTWNDEKTQNYELGLKSTFADGRVQFNAAAFYTDIDGLQVIADAGSCSSRIILNAEARTVGGEVELFARPSENWDFGVSATYNNAEITKSQLANGSPIAGIRKGNRLPTAPEFQAAASATYSWAWANSLESYLTFTFQHVGSSYTQLADQEPNFGLIATGGPAGSARFIPFGSPTINSFAFQAELPSYEIGNLRFGLKSGRWEAAAFVNNLWDERAFLSIDRERGRSARVGYLTNVPRTYGVSVNISF
jgi:iron complex outermembrane receptor protein